MTTETRSSESTAAIGVAVSSISSPRSRPDERVSGRSEGRGTCRAGSAARQSHGMPGGAATLTSTGRRLGVGAESRGVGSGRPGAQQQTVQTRLMQHARGTLAAAAVVDDGEAEARWAANSDATIAVKATTDVRSGWRSPFIVHPKQGIPSLPASRHYTEDPVCDNVGHTVGLVVHRRFVETTGVCHSYRVFAATRPPPHFPKKCGNRNNRQKPQGLRCRCNAGAHRIGAADGARTARCGGRQGSRRWLDRGPRSSWR